MIENVSRLLLAQLAEILEEETGRENKLGSLGFLNFIKFLLVGRS
jgi:hypothetical protein